MTTPIGDDDSFRYPVECSIPGCAAPPLAKVVASWSHGPLRELKNYGLACSNHLETLLARARVRRQQLVISDDEFVGPVESMLLSKSAPD